MAQQTFVRDAGYNPAIPASRAGGRMGSTALGLAP
jgi:hypothetical protein